MTKYAVVGDIHGCAGQLDILLKVKEFHSDRRIVFLGDYVDVGPSSAAVIDRLAALKHTHPETIFLQGNHDAGMLTYLCGGDFSEYALHGGIATIKDYCNTVFGDVREKFRESIPSLHMQFLRSLRAYFETEEYLFSHCGYSLSSPQDRSIVNMVMSSHQELFKKPASLAKTALFGHYFQSTLQPMISEGLICLDTGCGVRNGPLTAVLLPERIFLQIGVDGTLRRWALEE